MFMSPVNCNAAFESADDGDIFKLERGYKRPLKSIATNSCRSCCCHFFLINHTIPGNSTSKIQDIPVVECPQEPITSLQAPTNHDADIIYSALNASNVRNSSGCRDLSLSLSHVRLVCYRLPSDLDLYALAKSCLCHVQLEFLHILEV